MESYGLVGNSSKMIEIKALIQKVAPRDIPVLIEGESGTGKELVARAIHFNSLRRKNEFVIINCSAFPDTLLESELFGHMRGSFTGAISEKKGLFELADKGTFFLDEVGEMSPALQVKLLRVLQEGVFLKIGGLNPVKVDVRIIAATNRNLEKYVKEKKFRDDLFFRLNVMRLELPPLRDRKDDLPLLIDFISKKIAAKENTKPKKLTKEAAAVLKFHTWPGNVRELENEIEKAYILSDNELIDRKHLSPALLQASQGFSESAASSDESVYASVSKSLKIRKKEMVAKLEIQMIKESLARNQGNQTKTAEELQISRQDLIRKIKLYAI